MAKENTQKGEASIAGKLLNFIQRNRKGLLIFLCCAVLGTIAYAVGYSIKESSDKKSIAQLDEYVEKYSELWLSISGGTDNAEVDAFIADLTGFAKKKSGYSGAQAYLILGDIYAEREEWAKAEEVLVLSAAKAPGIFLAPVALFNAAVAAEEQGNPIKAIDYYTQASEYKGFFAGKSRAYFAIGRLYETQQDTSSALEMYRKVVDDWSSDEWSKLAQNRIIVLSN